MSLVQGQPSLPSQWHASLHRGGGTVRTEMHGKGDRIGRDGKENKRKRGNEIECCKEIKGS